MSNEEKICSNCGKPLTECTCQRKIIEIQHKGLGELGEQGKKPQSREELEKKVKDMEDVLGIQAQQHWKTESEKLTDEVEEFVSQASEDKQEELRKNFQFDIEDPDSLNRARDKLANAKMWTNILKSAVEVGGGKVTGTKRAPSGKSTMASPSGGMNAGMKQWIDTIYGTLKDPSKTPQEKAEANLMADQMVMEMIKGMNIAKQRGGRRFSDWQVFECPRCRKKIIQPRGIPAEECPSCGWKLYARDAVVSK